MGFNDEVKIGRPAIGITKKCSITLPDEYWEMLEQLEKETGASSRSELLRKILVITLNNEVKSKMQRNKGNHNAMPINDDLDEYPDEAWD